MNGEQVTRTGQSFRVIVTVLPVGPGHVPGDRKAADSTDEQSCTQLIDPALAYDMSKPHREYHRILHKASNM